MPKTETENTEKITLNFLTKFIKCFNGNRESLAAFLTNCDNAIALATTSQQDVLCKFILSQLEGKAQLACSLKTFANWAELKSFLKSTFGEKKHTSHLLIDLQNCKQGVNESVTQYALRIESCLTRIQADIHHSCTDYIILPGKIAAMEELALNTFLLGLNSNLSTIVRCRNPTNLNDAITHGVEEEKLYKLNGIASKPHKTCSVCNKSGHSSSDCYKRKSENFRRTYHVPQPSTSSNLQRGQLSTVCAYCKNVGHHINECRKRQFNNQRNANPQFQRQPPPSNSTPQNSARLHYYEETNPYSSPEDETKN